MAGMTDKHAAVKQARPRRSRAAPPLTPMIDVTFQLLLFFLLACQFRPQEGSLPGTLPGRPPVDGPQPREIKIALRPTGFDGTGRAIVSYFVDAHGRADVGITSPQRLYEKLVGGRIGDDWTDEVPILIEAGGDVPWRYVVEAFNQARRAKFKRIRLANRQY